MATVILAERLAAVAAVAGRVLRGIPRSSDHQRRASIPTRMLQHAGDTEACGTFIPADGGPTAIVVGARAPMESLQRLAAKHSLEPEALALFSRGA